MFPTFNYTKKKYSLLAYLLNATTYPNKGKGKLAQSDTVANQATCSTQKTSGFLEFGKTTSVQ